MDRRQRAAREILELFPKMMRHVAAELWRSDPPFSPSHLRLLAMLRESSHNLSEIADRVGVSLPTMSKTVSTLADRGWIRRTQAEKDRRRVRLELTPAGRRALGRIHARAVRRVGRLLERVSPDQGEVLLSGLRVLRRALAAGAAETRAARRAAS